LAGTHGPSRQARIAQAVEHSLGKGEVTGSSPVVGTTNDVSSRWVVFDQLK
jgi:hypothetical protein